MALLVFSNLALWQSILLCLLFSMIYVASLYVWFTGPEKSRDHPEIIKRRFISVAVVCICIPPLVWLSAQTSESENAHTILEWLGIRFWGLIPAAVLPLLLTMVSFVEGRPILLLQVLFLGPLSLHYMDGVFRLYLERRYWETSFKNLVWIRNHLVAPFTEEFIYRACMLPLLVPAIGPGWAVFICPLFFGVAHFHHMIEKVVLGETVIEAIKSALFQLFYTTLFGAYSAFIFLRTGHLLAPVLAHAFCNHMGFPAFQEVMGYAKPVRRRLILCFVAGLGLWIFLLYPLTNPWLYSNNIYDL